jgi:hypothetical protein
MQAEKKAPETSIKHYKLTKRDELNKLWAELDLEIQSFLPHWEMIAEYTRPRRMRVFVTDTNRGDRRNQKIINNTAAFASRTTQSGMMSGITHPARPWFRITIQDNEMAEMGAVKDWLHDVTEIMRATFAGSNLYKNLPGLYGDIADFATAAMLIEEDFLKVVRFQTMPLGTYRIAVNAAGRVVVYAREFQMTVRNLVDEYGRDFPGQEIQWERFSETVRNAWEAGLREKWVTVRHIIRPNPEFNPNRAESRYKKFESCTFEAGNLNAQIGSNATANPNDEGRYLREMGYDYFPVLVPRWGVNAEDAYGTDCPGMMSLGDNKALQALERLKGNAVEKSVKPPLVGSPGMKSARVSHIPGEISFVKETSDQKLRSMYEVRFDFSGVSEEIQRHENRIRKAYFEDLFLMISNDERATPPTAEEIIERRSEKMVALGPVYEQLNEDVFDDLIDITFDLLLKQGRIPEPPRELQGVPLKVEYVSIMAQAQKALGVGGFERFMGFTNRLAADSGDPTILDKIDRDQMVDEYANALGISPKVVRSDEEVARIRQSRAAQQKAQADAEMMANQAKAAKELSQADLETDNGLTRMVEMAQAGSPIPN